MAHKVKGWLEKMIIDPLNMTAKQNYKLLIGSVVPRPIAWVSTMSTDGIANLAPFSFFTVVSRNPPMLAFSVGEGVEEREGTVKDTLQNIRENKEFVVNIVTAPLANEMAKSGEHIAREIDEFEYAGLTAAESIEISVPRVLEAPINMECKLHDIIQLGDDHLIIGKLVKFHIKDELYQNGRINLEKLAPIGRLAGNYAPVETIFSLPIEDLDSILKTPVDKSENP
ncbi:flavin reductase (DIM6/NTAB) family NADH-FMN oxidoreductase RutF [Planomicrobium stackebrandtii]|uniref:Flavin reductase (DIM6/NTAB) family NADH-FMN oxidoreductase RutF n=1 Tax=Planomicrobium stackebrandtii TaxID=253160 RepID=A0ABU0GUY3_9BACL|nr:flavin reductase family protein [Planomicrobium stackebrandtii]MDQ0428888.1 flavin reductase (DIM6/NTAB) family NADH-FMN oxidoreductase RutF [Planomicrobium stackebrandtii]